MYLRMKSMPMAVGSCVLTREEGKLELDRRVSKVIGKGAGSVSIPVRKLGSDGAECVREECSDPGTVVFRSLLPFRVRLRTTIRSCDSLVVFAVTLNSNSSPPSSPVSTSPSPPHLCSTTFP